MGGEDPWGMWMRMDGQDSESVGLPCPIAISAWDQLRVSSLTLKSEALVHPSPSGGQNLIKNKKKKISFLY